MSSSTMQILGQLSVPEKRLPKAKKEFAEAMDAIKEVAVPVAEIGGEALTHLGANALSVVTGLPLQKFGLFAAPVVGKAAGFGTGLALEGVKELGSAIIDAASAVDNAIHSHSTPRTSMQIKPR